MSEGFRMVECLYTPSQLFCIFDYTKIAYLAGNYICLRQVATPDVAPSFIQLPGAQHSHSYLRLMAYPNLLVLAQNITPKDTLLHFYSVNGEHQQIKITSELARKADNEHISYEVHNSNKHIFLLVHRQMDLEIVVVSLTKKEVIARGFLTGPISQFKIKALDSTDKLSVVMPDSKEIVEYQLAQAKAEEPGLRIVEKSRIAVASKQVLHCWCKEELIVATGSIIKILIEGKEAQTIDCSRPVRMLVPVQGGFIALASGGMRVYRKSASVFDSEGDYLIENLPSGTIELSPQEDLLAFYSEKTKTIYYSNNWESSSSGGRPKTPVFSRISMLKEEKVQVYQSQQSLFAVTSGSNISIYSPVTYHCYLAMRANIRDGLQQQQQPQRGRLMRSSTLVSDKMLSQMSEGEHIETIGMHPTRPLVAIAYKHLVRVYLVLYQEFKLVKEIPLSHCKQLGFSQSGSIMFAKLGGKQGSKIYLYNVQNNFECLQILNTSRPVTQVLWSPLDTLLIALHSQGYYCWSLENSFKHKFQSTHQFVFTLKGAAVHHHSLIFWGGHHLVEMDFNHQPQHHVKLTQTISQLFVQRGQLVFSLQSGDLYHCKHLQQIENSILTPGFKLRPESQLYPVKNHTVLSLDQEGDIMCLEWGTDQTTSLQTVLIQRKKLIKFQEKYKQYEEQIKDIQEQMQNRIQILTEEYSHKFQKQNQYFGKELHDREERYKKIREEKFKIEEQMQQNMDIHEQDILKQVKQLEKMYERKIALTTNKLLTSDQIAFRNNLIAKENLVELEQKHADSIQQVRKQYGEAVQKQVSSKANAKEEVLALKKHYETRIAEMEIQNEELLRQFQNLNEINVVNLKKNVVNLELKYSEAVSQKYNLEKNVEDQRISLQNLSSKNYYLQERLAQEVRRGEQLSKENFNLETKLVEREQTITCLELRIAQLQKSNQIFKYRIIEIKNISDPKEEQILKMKDNMIELEEEYDKLSKRAHELEQHISLLRKDNQQLKNQLSTVSSKERRLDKNYGTLTDRLRQITKTPIQEIRKALLKLLEQFQRVGDINIHTADTVQEGPLQELNRVRQHLQVCLKDAVDTGKKNQKQKEIQVKRKNKQNSELLKEINDLRVKIYDLEAKLKDRELQIQELRRERKLYSSATKPLRERSSTHVDTEGERNHTRQSFFEKSLFRGHWKEKRLRTEQGSRKKSNLTHIRNETNHLYIQSKSDEVEEMKRILQQKEVIIKQLINKIHKLS